MRKGLPGTVPPERSGAGARPGAAPVVLYEEKAGQGDDDDDDVEVITEQVG